MPAMATYGTPAQSSADPRVDVAIAIIRRRGAVLICRRPATASFPGYWEFPGGKREPGESLAQCIEREVREELAMRVRPRHALTPIDHDYPARRIRLHPFVCDHDDGGEPALLACDAAVWVRPQDLHGYQFPPANEQLIREAVEYLALQPAEPAAPPVDFDAGPA
jgi:mutator protein MutT